MNRNEIIQIIAKYARNNGDNIRGYHSLGSLGITASIGLSILRNKLEVECKRKLPPINVAMKIDEIVAIIEDEKYQITPEYRNNGNNINEDVRPVDKMLLSKDLINDNSIGLGIDMQEVEEMPVAIDYRTHEYYVSNFTPSEISTAMLRSNPRLHLCGLFCAKEAARKSHPELINRRMSDFQVSHDAQGKPLIELLQSNVPFEFTISITHTERLAAAMCITKW